TGGPGALVEVLSALPASPPAPVVVLLHIDAAFAVPFADWLTTASGRTVTVARHGEPLQAGRILFAPPDRHLTVAGRRVTLVTSPPRHHCRPSIDVLFESVAAEYGDAAVAAVLTGMGRDGAAGLLDIRRAGGRTIAQDEATSVIWGMPREAIALGGAESVLPLDQIGPAIARLVTP
ncbi:MAG: chemotaxis protein CheB, partial [Deltaproteobacteria bacterium]|nr:chemotaxis protein CheB [Deltaproteobacteria bacterium]